MAKKKVFLSLPMSGKTNNDIMDQMKEMKEQFTKDYPDIDAEFVDNFIQDLSYGSYKNPAVVFLAEAIRKLADCDYIYLGKGFENARGCLVEDYISAHYGIERIFQEESERTILELKEEEPADEADYAKSVVDTIKNLGDNIAKYVQEKKEALLPNVFIRYHKEKYPDLQEIEVHGNFVDLRSATEVKIPAHSFAMIDLGVSMKIPNGYWGQLVPRSSTFKKYHIIETNSFGVIDTTYCGDDDIWMMPVFNLSDEEVTIPANERICQFRIVADIPMAIKPVNKLMNPNRGGFGSTDKK